MIVREKLFLNRASPQKENDEEETETLPTSVQQRSGSSSANDQAANHSKAVPNNRPPPPSLLGCLFGWLAPFRARKDNSSGVDETIQVHVQEKNV